MARKARRPGRHRPGSRDRAADRRDRPHHLDGDLRLRPAPVRGHGPVHARGRRARPRADGHRRGGRIRGQPDQARRPRRDPVQHLLRALLHVRQRTPVPVRDDAGARGGDGRDAVRLHEALWRGPRRPGRAAARPAGAVRADQGPRRPAGRPLRLSLGRAADRLAGRRVRRRSRRRQPTRAGSRPDRGDVDQDRPAARDRAGARRRPRAGAARARPQPRRAGDRPEREGRRSRGRPAGDRRDAAQTP